MGEVTKSLLVYLDTQDKEVEILVDCEYEVENNGIGEYEYWGQKCFDKGTDYDVIISWEWDKTGFTPEEIKEIEKSIDSVKMTWENEIDVSES